ncbi:MAG: sigma 54-interacting transcriptional regulator, partial [Calditrichaceae bacterium]
VASELFGHEKGAYTGAAQQSKGVFETGSDGTVFLDEIESIDSKVQLSLLHLLEQKQFTRLGGRQFIHTDTRVIAASNKNLEDLVDSGLLREDLFFRLDVFRIELPPLRERVSDILSIAEDMLSRFNHELNKNVIRISHECAEALELYKWPGNVRELKNVMQRAVLICDEDEIKEEHLPIRLHRRPDNSYKVIIEVGKSLSEVEKDMIEKTLSHTQNNRKKAAELLGITRRALYNKLHKHELV